MNANAQKLAAAVAANDKRLKKMRNPAGGCYVPRTTMIHHALGTVPSLHHALSYERALRLRPREWLERAT